MPDVNAAPRRRPNPHVIHLFRQDRDARPAPATEGPTLAEVEAARAAHRTLRQRLRARLLGR